MIAVAKVVISDNATQKALNRNEAIFLATAVITVFLAMVACYLIVRYVIVKPLKHLRDTSEEIARGNMEARAEIHTADEFEDVAVAFNKMVRHLVTTQDELKHTNAELDVKVDELAQTNMRLYEMNRLKSDFMATMSHELRTPLNSIIGFSEVLDSIKSLDDKQRRYVQNIQKSGRVLLDMINDILDLAKIESGKMEIRLTDFSHRTRRACAMRFLPAADRAEEHRFGSGCRTGRARSVSRSGQGAASHQQFAFQRDQVYAGRGPHYRCGRGAMPKAANCC